MVTLTKEAGSRVRCLSIVTLFLAVFFLTGCGEDRWHAFVYPNRADLTEYEMIGVYPGPESCVSAALTRLRELNATQTGDYECGLNCEFRVGWGDMQICEESVQ